MTQWKLVPVEPAEQQWNGLARKIIFAWDMDCNTPRKLFDYLDAACIDVPSWLRADPGMQNLDSVPSKGSRAAIIYRAMLEDAPQPPRLSDERIAQVIERAKAEWDAEADKHNQWGSLGLDEISLLIVRAIEREILGGGHE